MSKAIPSDTTPPSSSSHGSCTEPSASTTSALEALLPHLDTGDLVLFNRRCGTMGPVGAAVCLAAKLYGRYDHLGVVVREDEAEGGRLMLIDAGFNGVQYVDLKERVRRSKSHDIAVRRLHHFTRTPALREAMRAYVEEVRGYQYKQSILQMVASGLVTPAQWRREMLYLEVRQWEERVQGLKRELGGSQPFSSLERRALDKALEEARRQRLLALRALEGAEVSVFENKEDMGSGLFCSELVAAAYQRLGLLSAYPASNTYIPTDFASAKPVSVLGRGVASLRRESLNLLQGACLGEEIPVRWEGEDVDAGLLLPGKESGGATGNEGAAGPDSYWLARALKKLAVTSGTVEEGDGNESDDCVPAELLGLFQEVVPDDAEMIHVFSEGGQSPSLYVVAEGEVDLFEERLEEEEGEGFGASRPEWTTSNADRRGGKRNSTSLPVCADSTSASATPPVPPPDHRLPPSQPRCRREKRLLATLGPGMAFGGPGCPPSSLSPSLSPSSLLAIARGDHVRLWRVHGKDISTLLRGRETPGRPRTPSEKERLGSVLDSHPYFAALGGRGKKEKERAMERFFLLRVKKGENIVKQGDRGECFYVLDKGQARIVREKARPRALASPLNPIEEKKTLTGVGRDGGERGQSETISNLIVTPSTPSSFLVASAGPGAFFGEAAALFNSRRGASVVAEEDCRLWALGRLDFMQLTGKGGSPSLLDFFLHHASVVVTSERGGEGREEERYMTHADFLSAFFPPPSAPPSSSSSSSPPVPVPRRLLKALDWTDSGLVSFSELVHLDIWMHSPSPHVQVAMRLSQRDSGYQQVTLGDWAALREAARREEEREERGRDSEDALEEEEERRFIARVFGKRGQKRPWWGRKKAPASSWDHDLQEASLSLSSSTASYSSFVEALASPDCPQRVRRFLESIHREVVGLRRGWEEMVTPTGERAQRSLRRAGTVLAVGARPDGEAFREGISHASPGAGGSPSRPASETASGALPSSSSLQVASPDVWRMVLAAGVGGAVARLAVAPLERAKILIQTYPASRPPLRFRGALRLILDPRYTQPPWGGVLYRHTRGLFVGNGLNMLRILPVLAVQVFLYQYLRDHALRPLAPAFPFSPTSPSSSPSAATASGPTDARTTTWALNLGASMPPPPHSTTLPPGPLPLETKHMLAGGLAGVAANLLFHPLDTLRARITAQTASSRPYPEGVWQATLYIWKQEGPRAFWRGATPCAVWAFLYIGINYTCLAFLAPLALHRHRHSSLPLARPTDPLSAPSSPPPSSAILSVLAAGAVAQSIAYPFDLLRRRMQLGWGEGLKLERKGIFTSLSSLWGQAKMAVREGRGLRGLYRGYPVVLLKVLPTTVVSYRVSSGVTQWLEESA